MTTFATTLTLTQNGPMGLIREETKFDPAPTPDHVPACYEAMTNIMASYLMAKSQFAPHLEEDADGEKYKAVLAMWTDEDENTRVSLEFTPRIELKQGMDPTTYPAVYQLSSHVLTQYMMMLGVIDEEGNVRDEDSLDNVSIAATTAAPSVH